MQEVIVYDSPLEAAFYAWWMENPHKFLAFWVIVLVVLVAFFSVGVKKGWVK